MKIGCIFFVLFCICTIIVIVSDLSLQRKIAQSNLNPNFCRLSEAKHYKSCVARMVDRNTLAAADTGVIMANNQKF